MNQVQQRCLVKHAYLPICMEMEGVLTDFSFFMASSLFLWLGFDHSKPKF